MIKKAVIFDLDETIGYFTELGLLWDCLQIYFKNKLNQGDFNQLCDLYHFYFRPDIFTTFHLLKYFKKRLYVLIYTNNNGPKSWTLLIKNYSEHKIKFKLFDQVICAYKVDGQQVEKNRTTYNKTY